jgi:hypothetical protein
MEAFEGWWIGAVRIVQHLLVAAPLLIIFFRILLCFLGRCLHHIMITCTSELAAWSCSPLVRPVGLISRAHFVVMLCTFWRSFPIILDACHVHYYSVFYFVVNVVVVVCDSREIRAIPGGNSGSG